jgi:hypothetical protein
MTVLNYFLNTNSQNFQYHCHDTHCRSAVFLHAVPQVNCRNIMGGLLFFCMLFPCMLFFMFTTKMPSEALLFCMMFIIFTVGLLFLCMLFLMFPADPNERLAVPYAVSNIHDRPGALLHAVPHVHRYDTLGRPAVLLRAVPHNQPP